MFRVLHITEPTFDFNTINKDSVLLNRVDQILDQEQYHTSLGDLSCQAILSLVDQFTSIDFVLQGFNQQSDIYKETVILLNSLSHCIPVTNFSRDKPIQFAAQPNRSISDPVLWVFGCSHSYGVGLDSVHQRYSNILACKLDLPLLSVTKPGGSVDWSLQQLQQAEIKSTDTVIWQITTPSRITVCRSYDGHVTDYMLKDSDLHAVGFYTDTQLFFKHMSVFNFGTRLLKEIGVRFRIISIDNDDELSRHCKIEYTKHAEYCYIPGSRRDLGIDNLHVGPKSHQYIAEKIFEHLTKPIGTVKISL